MGYRVKFINETDRTWTMGVYQTLPSASGLDSVAWKLATVPRRGITRVEWDVTYNVALADYRQQDEIGVYQASQVLSTSPGTVWDVVFEGGQQLKLTDEEAPLREQIIIRNRTNQMANPGIGMDGAPSVYKHDTSSGSDAQFLVPPTYWVGLFKKEVVLGQVISSDVTAGPPLMLTFPSGENLAILTASLDEQRLRLDLRYGSTVSRVATSLIAPLDIEAAA